VDAIERLYINTSIYSEKHSYFWLPRSVENRFMTQCVFDVKHDNLNLLQEYNILLQYYNFDCRLPELIYFKSDE
jgi:hypothetical protein